MGFESERTKRMAHANVYFLYSVKTSENLRFPDIFRGIEKIIWHETD